MNALKKVLWIALLAALGGCGFSLPGGIDKTAKADAPAPAAEKALGDYLHDLSPVIDGVTVANALVEHYVIPTSDGISLDSWIRRPAGAGVDEKQPLVLYFTPYYGGGDPTSALNLLGDPSLILANYLVPRGYAVGLVSVRGTGNSSGCYTSGGVAERREMGEAVQYLAAQPWSNGKVGTIGVSFDGATSAELFTEAPPALKTVVPIEAVTDYYRYGFNNGILRFINGAYPTYYVPVSDLLPVGLEGGTGPTDPSGYLTRAVVGYVCADHITTQLSSVFNVLTANRTAFWRERDLPAIVAATPDKPRPAMFYIQGHQDANVDNLMSEEWLSAVRATGVPLHVWFGQWVHEYAQPTDGPCAESAPCRGDFWQQALLAWFDQFLKGKDTGILDAPAVQTQADDRVWRHENEWPPANLTQQLLYPQADGALGDAPATGSVSYKDNLITAPTELDPVNQALLPAPISGTVLEFVSAPLAQPLRLTGTPLLESVVTASGIKANLVATLLARKPDGSQRYINFAAQSLNHVSDPENGDLSVSGKVLPLRLKFFPQDNIIPAGEQLVLEISGTVAQTHTLDDGNSVNLLNYGPRLMPIGAGATVALDLAQTRLTLLLNPGNRVEPLPWLQTEAAAP